MKFTNLLLALTFVVYCGLAVKAFGQYGLDGYQVPQPPSIESQVEAFADSLRGEQDVKYFWTINQQLVEGNVGVYDVEVVMDGHRLRFILAFKDGVMVDIKHIETEAEVDCQKEHAQAGPEATNGGY